MESVEADQKNLNHEHQRTKTTQLQRVQALLEKHRLSRRQMHHRITLVG